MVSSLQWVRWQTTATPLKGLVRAVLYDRNASTLKEQGDEIGA
jgi:hypothetical protein